MTNPIHEPAPSPLRLRMIVDMKGRRLSAQTQKAYLRSVEKFASFLGRSPETASRDDFRKFQQHLAESGIGAGQINSHITGLRFFFRTTLERGDAERYLQFVREPRKLPTVLTPSEVAALIDAAPGPGLKYKAALSVSYGAGLRANEVVHLKVSDIDSERMIIRLEQGKGDRDRQVMLSPHLLELLRAHWRQTRSKGWLFPGQKPAAPISTRQLNRAIHTATDMAGIDKRVTLHTLRHSFATHLLEQNIDVRVIQTLLGHAKLDTTALYTRVAAKTIRDVTSPLDRIRRDNASAS